MPKKNLKQELLKKQNLVFLMFGLFFLFTFFAFTLWVRADHLRSFDFDTTVRVQNITPLRIDPFFSFLSVIGRFEFTATTLFIVLLIWSKLKLKRLAAVFLIMGFLALGHIFELIGKTILEQPGPPNMFLRSQFSQFPGLYVHTDASYPSGHSLRIVFIMSIYAFLIFKSNFSLIIKFAFYAFSAMCIFIMLYSRVSLGEHWSTDVIGGSLLGISMALFSLILLF